MCKLHCIKVPASLQELLDGSARQEAAIPHIRATLERMSAAKPAKALTGPFCYHYTGYAAFQTPPNVRCGV